jgi:diguanylate cyclase (GGDEF)-like protein
MRLRTRIALTFIALLMIVLATALLIVSAANRDNAAREVDRQLDVGALVFKRVLEANRRQLSQAATAVALDYGFREAVATRDTDTLVSALENSGDRIHAAMVVLVSLDGRVIASTGTSIKAGKIFEPARVLMGSSNSGTESTVFVEGNRIFELVVVPVRSPLTVAWIAIGFELNEAAARELAGITGLGVTLAIGHGGHAKVVVGTEASQGHSAAEVSKRPIVLASTPEAEVTAVLSRSLVDARAPFARLTRVLYLVAVVSLLATAGAAFWLARNITRPLHNLTAAIHKIRGGNYAAAVAIERKDELGILAEGLLLMQSAIQTRDQSIRQLAYEDPLTGLVNRTAFAAALDRELNTPSGSRVAIAVINVDRFRRINECLGYSVGDEVLKTIARRLVAAPALARTVARIAADQFAIFSVLENNSNGLAWGASILSRLVDPIRVADQPIDISASLGLASAPADGKQVDELIRCAELALEQARREKRALGVYEASLMPATRDQLSLLGELQRAVDQNELRLFYQPKLELSTLRVAGAEVLLRWEHPTRGLLGPAAFIPFAEQTGFVRRLTRWVLDSAAAQAAKWCDAGCPVSLSVNISAEDIADPILDQRVAAVLARYELPPGLMTLEVTESGFIENPERALLMLETLANLGVRLSIDDFGTGYSSLSYLARMPVNEVKIDRSFVQGIESDSAFAAIVRAAIEMGHSLGLKVVAEGIETRDSADRLQAMQCDVAQGYLFARPMPIEEFERWLAGRDRVPVDAAPRRFVIDNDALSDVTDVFRASHRVVRQLRG